MNISRTSLSFKLKKSQTHDERYWKALQKGLHEFVQRIHDGDQKTFDIDT